MSSDSSSISSVEPLQQTPRTNLDFISKSTVHPSRNRSHRSTMSSDRSSISSVEPLQQTQRTNLDFISKCVDTAINRYIQDPASEELSLEIEISQLAWRERRLSSVLIPMTVEEKRFKTLQQRLEMVQYVANAKPDAHERRRRVRKACDKLREHILEMRPFNPFPPRRSLASSLLDDSGASTARSVSQGGAASFSRVPVEKQVAEMRAHRSRSPSPFPGLKKPGRPGK
uniref:BHLH domain-containing protein n=1 Tax=Steinernema glaseri TaxID=37863 RepID=A0A1I7ZWX4_9BILA